MNLYEKNQSVRKGKLGLVISSQGKKWLSQKSDLVILEILEKFKPGYLIELAT